MEITENVMDFSSDSYKVDGVEFRVGIQRKSQEVNERPMPKILARCILYAKNEDYDVQKFVLATVEVKEKQREGRSGGFDPFALVPRFATIWEAKTERFVLKEDTDEEIVGIRRVLPKRSPNENVYYVYIAVAVQRITAMKIGEFCDESAVVVVVKNKEFRVSAEYLSYWSLYFRAYFRADMKEKKEGRYPIKDEDITVEDFEELLLVISPSDKPITSSNFRQLLKLASRFEMPELTRRIELFLIDFERNELSRARIFRIAADFYDLKLVRSTLLYRWRDPRLFQNELMITPEYEKLSADTKALVNESLAQAFIHVPSALGKRMERIPPRPDMDRGRYRYGYGGNENDYEEEGGGWDVEYVEEKMPPWCKGVYDGCDSS